MMRHQRRTIQGPVSDVALRGRSKGHHATAMLASPANASPFCKNLDSNDAGMAQILKAAGISLLASGIGAVADMKSGATPDYESGIRSSNLFERAIQVIVWHRVSLSCLPLHGRRFAIGLQTLFAVSSRS